MKDKSWPQFRALRPDEVDVRVQQVMPNGVICLLYKDARTDMTLLDETVGPMNWKREHTRENANCIISIWDDEKSAWVSKEDTGTESNTEKEKGLASDSFKRAGTNWGIGRELYTAPFIWVPKNLVTIEDTGKKDKYGNPVLRCKTRFYVSTMDVVDKRIVRLSIKDENHHTVFRYGPVNPPSTDKSNSDAENLTGSQPVTPDIPDVEIAVAKSMCQTAMKAYAQRSGKGNKEVNDAVRECIGKNYKDFTVDDWRSAAQAVEGWK